MPPGYESRGALLLSLYALLSAIERLSAGSPAPLRCSPPGRVQRGADTPDWMLDGQDLPAHARTRECSRSLSDGSARAKGIAHHAGSCRCTARGWQFRRDPRCAIDFRSCIWRGVALGISEPIAWNLRRCGALGFAALGRLRNSLRVLELHSHSKH